MPPSEHRPIIFNYGLQSKVSSCPLYGVSGNILSVGMTWCPISEHAPSYGPNCDSRGDQKTIAGVRRNLNLKWAEGYVPPTLGHILL